jgi:CRP-like cAMP-binding protein
MEPYDFLGEAALFHESTRICTVTAETDVSVILFGSMVN